MCWLHTAAYTRYWRGLHSALCGSIYILVHMKYRVRRVQRLPKETESTDFKNDKEIWKKMYANKVNQLDEILKMHAKAHSRRNLSSPDSTTFI